MKVLNLYCGIGGNRKLWTDVEVTAVELNPKIAEIYSHFFPKDKMVIGDAHQYLLDHYKGYDFIWSSPPCPTHSRLNEVFTKGNATNPVTYPDMKLYQEIILLKKHFNGLFCVENVISYYKPLIAPIESNSHYFWTNFYFKPLLNIKRNHYSEMEELSKFKGFDISSFSGIDKRKTLRNCVQPEIGLHILEAAKEHLRNQKENKDLFNV